MFFLTEQRWAD